jgi:hypothetical protein
MVRKFYYISSEKVTGYEKARAVCPNKYGTIVTIK